MLYYVYKGCVSHSHSLRGVPNGSRAFPNQRKLDPVRGQVVRSIQKCLVIYSHFSLCYTTGYTPLAMLGSRHSKSHYSFNKISVFLSVQCVTLEYHALAHDRLWTKCNSTTIVAAVSSGLIMCDHTNDLLGLVGKLSSKFASTSRLSVRKERCL